MLLLPWAYLWRGPVSRAQPAEGGGSMGQASPSRRPRLHLSFCDKSISRAAVLHLHPAEARGPAAPWCTLSPGLGVCACVHACLIDFPSTFL